MCGEGRGKKATGISSGAGMGWGGGGLYVERVGGGGGLTQPELWWTYRLMDRTGAKVVFCCKSGPKWNYSSLVEILTPPGDKNWDWRENEISSDTWWVLSVRALLGCKETALWFSLLWKAHTLNIFRAQVQQYVTFATFAAAKNDLVGPSPASFNGASFFFFFFCGYEELPDKLCIYIPYMYLAWRQLRSFAGEKGTTTTQFYT